VNGYLQRLVTRELNSASSIHPIVGSFFLAPRLERTPESLRQEEHQPDMRQERNIPYRAQTEEAVESGSGARPSPLESKGADFRRSALLPEPISRKSRPPLAGRTLNGVIERLMEPPATTEQRESVKQPVPPTIPELRRFDAVSEDPITQSIAGAINSAEPRNPSWDRSYPFATESKSETPDRKPEEIQIHIGRIEVMAVQPAPAILPAPKPRHAAPSLEEYLRRRDRRTQ